MVLGIMGTETFMSGRQGERYSLGEQDTKSIKGSIRTENYDCLNRRMLFIPKATKEQVPPGTNSPYSRRNSVNVHMHGLIKTLKLKYRRPRQVVGKNDMIHLCFQWKTTRLPFGWDVEGQSSQSRTSVNSGIHKDDTTLNSLQQDF